eukprot:CAMPEP_0206214904 /NCGR_PEP_ID=MMETSP0047_2-20121206/1913_1 /ASSEMBLY_ACC=CAM_ASM_000192 /TAXON_ID=195065 /ORGANISM="Chroomonas mesostigmatica_cf, Strain CCMP1168" /LENGTH=71 /DNA_ID=CAMNT_0053637169 /DNA_START=30 /DNA_END=245 /DNA_ORIENTATION=-
MFSKIAAAQPVVESLYQDKKPANTEMLAGWLNGGFKTQAFARPAPYAQGSIIPGSNYSAQDNHDSLKISGM